MSPLLHFRVLAEVPLPQERKPAEQNTRMTRSRSQKLPDMPPPASHRPPLSSAGQPRKRAAKPPLQGGQPPLARTRSKSTKTEPLQAADVAGNVHQSHTQGREDPADSTLENKENAAAPDCEARIYTPEADSPQLQTEDLVCPGQSVVLQATISRLRMQCQGCVVVVSSFILELRSQFAKEN